MGRVLRCGDSGPVSREFSCRFLGRAPATARSLYSGGSQTGRSSLPVCARTSKDLTFHLRGERVQFPLVLTSNSGAKQAFVLPTGDSVPEVILSYVLHDFASLS